MTEPDFVRPPEKPGEMQISNATQKDLDEVWKVVEENAKWLAELGLGHWKKYYTQNMVGKMIERKNVYLGRINGEAVGTVTYDLKPPKYYNEPGYADLFSNPEAPAAFITALAVMPEMHGRGLGEKLLRHVEDQARWAGAKWLRLDCREEVPGLVGFYEKRGYTRLGEEAIDEGDDGSYWLMEKHI